MSEPRLLPNAQVYVIRGETDAQVLAAVADFLVDLSAAQRLDFELTATLLAYVPFTDDTDPETPPVGAYIVIER